MTTYERIAQRNKQEGKQEGIREGKQEGIREGKAEVVLKCYDKV